MAANNIYIQIDVNSQSAQQNVNALNQQIANTGPTTEKAAKQASSGFQTIGVSIRQVNNEFAQLTAAIAGLGIARAIGGMVQMAAELSRTTQAMTYFAGSAAEAKKVFEDIRAIAATSPFRFKELEETGQRLLGFGLAAKNVPDTLKVITDQVSRMGGSIEGVNTIVNLFGRIMEKNFVGAMDLTRALPAQGVPALKALGKALEEVFHRPFDAEQTKTAIKEGILEPLQTVRVIVESMRKPFSFSNDAARTFKNLADAADNALSKLFGPEGFGPALTKLGEDVGKLVAPLGGLIDMLMKLPEHTKETIVQVTAAAAAFAIFGTALGIVTALTNPLLGLVGSIAKFTVSLVAMNPELAITAVLLGGLGYALYQLVPQVKAFTDNLIGPIVTKIKGTLTSLGEEGKKFFAGLFGGGTPIEIKPLINTTELFEKLQKEEQKHANEAQRSLLEALASPVEAVKLKYKTLFAELEDKMKDIKDETQRTTLTGILKGAQSSEEAGAAFKVARKLADEQTRYLVERSKGATDAEVAYIEAQEAQTLRGRVRAIDYITERRIAGAEDVAKIEKDNLENEFQAFAKMATKYKEEFAAAGINVEQMIQTRREETNAKQQHFEQKQFDEMQKYRLEGWKKANDAIIEEQKRVYDAFKDQFSQLFDAFSDKTKSLGQALGDFAKKLVMGEAKELFATTMAAGATQAAGYGRPEESMNRGGGGILGTLLRRGMPPRPPLPPPEVQQIPQAASVVNFPSSMTGSAQRFEISTDAYSVATLRFEQAVQNFAGATMSSKGSADRAMPETGTQFSGAFQSAASATGVPEPLLRAVAQAESNMNPLALSPKGAMGLMQLMPRTAAGRGVSNPYDPGQNVMGGSQELKWLLQRYHGDIPSVLAAYNMGSSAFDDRRASGRALPRETQRYVAQITRMLAAAGPDTTTPQVTVAQLAALPSSEGQFLRALPGGPLNPFPSGTLGGGSAYTGPSVAQLAALPQGASAMASLGMLGPIGTGALKAGGVSLKAGAGLPNMANLGQFFGIYKGVTSPLSVATSPAMGMLATIGGMALASKGLQQHYAPATTLGGGLAGAGYVLSNPAMLDKFGAAGIGAGAAIGAGAGLFASGFQRGGGAGLGMDIGGGALAGAGIGFMAGGPMGAAIGAAIGAGVGAITGIVRLFVHTEQERIRTGIKQVYGIDISNRQILTQIQQIVDQKYGGSVTIGIRSQDVQDIVRLYALSTGQAANLPRPMYAATIAQSQAGGLATQPVYQGGVLVQNPYTGPTTYQYQTAVTAAQGLMAGTNQGVPGAGNQVSNIFMQLNPQQANDLFTGRVVQAVQQNPAAVASANSRATRAGDSRVTQASNMLEPLTSLS